MRCWDALRIAIMISTLLSIVTGSAHRNLRTEKTTKNVLES